MVQVLSAVFLVVLSPPLLAQAPPTVSIPTTAGAKPGRLLKLTATTNCKNLQWINFDTDNADLIVSESGMSAVFSAPVAGVYKVGVYGAQGDVPTPISVCSITVGTPGPSPGPGPGPVDPLTASLQTAYTADTDASKAAFLAWIQLTYASAGDLVSDGMDTAVLFNEVVGILHDKVKGYPKGGMPKLTKAIGDYLDANVGKTGPINATKTKAAFAAVAKALSNVK